MREGCYEVLLVHGDGAHEISFDEFILKNGHIYASCEPGLEYTVKVNIYRDPRTGKFPTDYLRVGLYCDGMDVKYWKRLDMSNPDKLPHYVTAKFMGFKKSSQDLRAFVFSTPAIDSHNQPAGGKIADKQLGQIKVVFHEATLIGGIFDNNTTVNEVPTAPDLISENKKFWEQASVTTTAGRKITNQKEVFVPLIRWANTSHDPCKALLLYYHSRQVIEFLLSMQNNDNRNEKRKHIVSAVATDNDDNNDDNDDEIEVHQPAKIAHILDLTNSDDENDESAKTWKTIVINPPA